MENVICIAGMVFAAVMCVCMACVAFGTWKALFVLPKVNKNDAMAVVASTLTTAFFAVCTVILFNQLSF